MRIAWPGKTVRMTATAACLGVAALMAIPSAMAQFNTDALKSMQKEGHKILEEAQAQSEAEAQTQAQTPAQARRPYRLRGNLCLNAVGDGLTVSACDGRASQGWLFDAQRRLVAHTGQCVMGARLRQCGTGNGQLWRHDAQKRLVNDAGVCLQAQGNPPKAGARVVAARCSGAFTQVWN